MTGALSTAALKFSSELTNPCSNIVHPYPLSHFCQPPSENTVTDASLCLKLPDSVFRPTTARSALRPILAPVPRTAAPALAPLREGSPSEDHPFPPGVFLPGPVSVPGAPTVAHFVPAFHGSDHPKIDGVQVVVSSPSPSTGSDAGSTSTSLWADYGTEEARAAPTECSAHGTVCNSGICKICAQRAREERLVERERERAQDRETWRQAKGRRQRANGQQQDSGGGSERGSSPDLGARPSRLSANVLAHTGSGKRSERGSAPAMPAHLRRGAGASSCAASSRTAVSSRATLSSTRTSSPSTDAGEGDEDEDDTHSVISSSPSETPSATSSIAPSTMGAWQKPMPSFLRRGAGPAAAPAAPSEGTVKGGATKKPMFLTSVAPSARGGAASGPPAAVPPKNAWVTRKQWAVPSEPSITSAGGSSTPGVARPKGSSGLPPPARVRPSSIGDDSASEGQGLTPSCVYAPRVRHDWADSLSDSDLDPEPF